MVLLLPPVITTHMHKDTRPREGGAVSSSRDENYRLRNNRPGPAQRTLAPAWPCWKRLLLLDGCCIWSSLSAFSSSRSRLGGVSGQLGVPVLRRRNRSRCVLKARTPRRDGNETRPGTGPVITHTHTHSTYTYSDLPLQPHRSPPPCLSQQGEFRQATRKPGNQDSRTSAGTAQKVVSVLIPADPGSRRTQHLFQIGFSTFNPQFPNPPLELKQPIRRQPSSAALFLHLPSGFMDLRIGFLNSNKKQPVISFRKQTVYFRWGLLTFFLPFYKSKVLN